MDNRCEVSNECLRHSSLEAPNANSTMIEETGSDMSRHGPSNNNSPRSYSVNSALKNDSTLHSNNTPRNYSINSAQRNISKQPEIYESEDYNVGHISHIPRKPPTPTTYTVPSCMSKSLATDHNGSDDLFGMIKLKDNDVCYTSGSIEWVGRKRSYPINSGFKVINESFRQGNEPCLKRVRRLDKTFTVGEDKIKECDCADVLPTVNAIVDHLNALHEAVDLVDLRLNNLEDTIQN